MATSKMYRSAAVLQVPDVVKSAEFYRDKLGFEIAGFWGEPPCFSIVGRDTVTVFLDRSEAGIAVPLNQNWAVYIYVEDVDALCAELQAKGVEVARGPDDAIYGCREIDLRDPDGHLFCFGQDLHPSPAGPGL
jgi:catechol 2,3-dioxygenase-like lactoylglutathione lyase family enzyme